MMMNRLRQFSKFFLHIIMYNLSIIIVLRELFENYAEN